MQTIAGLVQALGGPVTLALPATGAVVDDVVILEPGREHQLLPGDLVLGVGVDTHGAHRLLAALAAAGVRGLVLRAEITADPDVREIAAGAAIALVALADETTWEQAFALLRGILDTHPWGPDAASPGDELTALAEAAATLVDGPITIEDARSRVLAHSGGLERIDPARVSTIVGRRVPPEVLKALRARGVFRRLAGNDDPFFLPAVTDQLGARFVVPVRAGGEWLGSLWAMVDAPPPAAVVAELQRTAATVALHQLRARAHAHLAQRGRADQLRRAVTEGDPGIVGWLPPGPWRVALLEGAPADQPLPPEQAAALWAAVLRRRGWRQPLVVDLDDDVLAVLAEGPARVPGSWPWLGAEVARLADRAGPGGSDRTGRSGGTEGGAGGGGVPIRALAGTPAPLPLGLVRSWAEAQEVARLPRDPRTTGGPACTAEQAWVALTLDRATRALAATGPLPALADLPDAGTREGALDRATLAAFLDHPGDPGRAASELGIHVNTLRYRMTRIRAALTVDLDDPATRLALQLLLRAPRAAVTPPEPL